MLGLLEPVVKVIKVGVFIPFFKVVKVVTKVIFILVVLISTIGGIFITGKGLRYRRPP